MASILIVEDERIIARDLETTLVRLGYEVSGSAASAAEALRLAAERIPDLVLMDVRIQGELDGIDAAKLIRERFGTPVVYVTAYADRATLARAREAQPYGYVIKPFNESALHSAIEMSLFKHHMECRLHERERWFSTTLRCLGDAVLAVDKAGALTFMNLAAELIVGKRQEDLLGKNLSEVFQLVHERTLEPVANPLQRALKEGRVVSLPNDTVLDAGGGRRPIEDSAAPIIDDSGNLLGAVLVFRDVSERRALEQQLALADRLSSLGTLAASIAHEINNPLAYILANAAFAVRELEQIKQRLEAPDPPLGDLLAKLDSTIEAANELQLGSERLRQIVADLRAFGRPERGESSLVQLEAVIQWALRITEPEIARHGRVTTSFGAVPAVLGSETRLGQVFVNLLTNAAHALEQSSAADPLVAVSTETDAEGWAVIAIKDTGSGIAAASMPQLFEPFFTTKAMGQGSGLGLAVCHGIVKAMGGEISVASQVGEGSTFRVRLPPAPHLQSQAGESARGGAVLRGRLLVVDDEPLLLSAMERMLKLHHDVVVSSSAERALRLVQKGEVFDLVLYDLTMPGLTAMDFYERVLEHKPALAQRIVFVSGGAFTARAQEFLSSVSNARLHKPFNPDQLLDFVQAFLRRRPR